jgi:membrane complex biogenesis BtpA family protein
MLNFSARAPLLIGVVHLSPTPGSPRYGGSFQDVVERACADAVALAENGCDALIVENFGDTPFHPANVPPETVASLALCVERIAERVRALPIGVNVLRNDARAALAICATTSACFVRVNVHCGAAVTDQGFVEGRAHETLRERARLGKAVSILADAHVKHATPLSRESLSEAVSDLVGRGLADAVIVSGRATGHAPTPDDVRDAQRAAGGKPVLVGSGLTVDNAKELMQHAAGAIVGTSLKRDGRVELAVDPARVARLRTTFDALVRRA